MYPGAYQLSVLVCDFDGNFICRVDQAEALHTSTNQEKHHD